FPTRRSSDLHRYFFENKYLVLAVLSSVLLLIGVIYIDALQPIFKTVDLGMRDWSLVIVFAGIPTFLMGAGSVLRGAPKKKKIYYGGSPTGSGTKPIVR